MTFEGKVRRIIAFVQGKQAYENKFTGDEKKIHFRSFSVLVGISILYSFSIIYWYKGKYVQLKPIIFYIGSHLLIKFFLKYLNKPIKSKTFLFFFVRTVAKSSLIRKQIAVKKKELEYLFRYYYSFTINFYFWKRIH